MADAADLFTQSATRSSSGSISPEWTGPRRQRSGRLVAEGPAAGVKAMELKNIIKHHRYEAEHAKRLRALVVADFHIKAAVAGWTMMRLRCQFAQRRDSNTQNSRSPGRKHGRRVPVRCSTAS